MIKMDTFSLTRKEVITIICGFVMSLFKSDWALSVIQSNKQHRSYLNIEWLLSDSVFI